MTYAASLPSVFDAQSLAAIKTRVRQDDPQALKAAAQQFEALFLQMVLKSMRAATPQDGPFDSDQTRFYQELLDAQLAQVLASKGGTGLAALIERQLAPAPQGAAGDETEGLPLAPASPALPWRPPRAYPLPGREQSAPALPLEGAPVRPAAVESPRGAVLSAPTSAFLSAVWPYAVDTARATGIPAQFIVAHAALESGWGRAEPRFADGRSSYNLFGIKAGSGWNGPVVEAGTTEYQEGVPTRRVERFRAYGSYAEAFADYAQLLAGSPRYAGVRGSRDAAGFAQGLQRAGYATDPAYADKLQRLIGLLG
ncbi:MAG: flagellar assembly peptidoglycan hydrolase FlgJ [Rhodocyclaceae bacterium]|jgi:flagellar protein FlgJ|nr:flagellar assembly peptidoglycan hydrolase FlgJ [Rhodocyclaceae bacterium]